MIVSLAGLVTKAGIRVTRITTMGLMMKRIALLTLGFLMVCNCAFATITPLGTLTSVPTLFSDSHGAGQFTDYFSFSLSAPSNVMTFSSWIEGETVLPIGTFRFDINDLDINLFSSSSFNDVDKIDPIGSFEDDNSLTYFFSSLLSGTYYFSVTGSVPALNTGIYNGLASASQVPVPAAALLLGAGLLGIVGIRRRPTV